MTLVHRLGQSLGAVLAGTVLAVGAAAGLNGGAASATTPPIGTYLLKNPYPSWVATPRSVAPLAEGETEELAIQFGQRPTVAVGAWAPKSGHGALVIELIQFKTSASSRLGGATGLDRICAGNKQAPSGIVAVSGLAGGYATICQATASAAPESAVAWVQGSVLFYVLGIGLPTPAVEQVAVAQGHALPASITAIPSSFPVGPVIGSSLIAAVVIVFVVAMLAMRRSRRRQMEAQPSET